MGGDPREGRIAVKDGEQVAKNSVGKCSSEGRVVVMIVGDDPTTKREIGAEPAEIGDEIRARKLDTNEDSGDRDPNQRSDVGRVFQTHAARYQSWDNRARAARQSGCCWGGPSVIFV